MRQYFSKPSGRSWRVRTAEGNGQKSSFYNARGCCSAVIAFCRETDKLINDENCIASWSRLWMPQPHPSLQSQVKEVRCLVMPPQWGNP